MRILRHYSGIPSEARGAVVALGNFDGVHLGHRAVIGRARAIAGREGAPLGVLTFEPHPVQVLRPESAPHRLTPFRVKARRLAEIDVDVLFALHFDTAFSRKSAEDFVDEVLVRELGIRHAVVGHDFHFGCERRGNPAFLAERAALHGFDVTIVEPVGNAGEVYSSTRVRSYLKRGEPRLAAAILGHLWEVEGRVQHGDARGRTLGYPTANLSFADYVAPAFGIYAVWAGIVDGDDTTWYPAVASVGVRPTFGGGEPLLEVHLFDVDMGLYDAHLRVAFVAWIRPEMKFDDVDALKAEMARDCETARAILEGSVPPPEPSDRPAPAAARRANP